MFIQINLKGTLRTNFRGYKYFLSNFLSLILLAPPYKPPDHASHPAGWCHLGSSASRRTPQMLAPIYLWLKRQICVWAVQKDIKKWWLWWLISHFALGDDVQSCYNQHNSASYTINHTYCACHRLLKENISQTETFRHFQVCSPPYICKWMRPAMWVIWLNPHVNST